MRQSPPIVLTSFRSNMITELEGYEVDKHYNFNGLVTKLKKTLSDFDVSMIFVPRYYQSKSEISSLDVWVHTSESQGSYSEYVQMQVALSKAFGFVVNLYAFRDIILFGKPEDMQNMREWLLRVDGEYNAAG